MKKTIVSGAQATGNLHLGNYLGALVRWVKMRENHNCFFFLADLHAITVPQSPEKLKASTLSSAAIYLAAGLDPSKITIFAQSSVKEHSELAWILNCVTPLGWLKRMTQFKDKAAKNQDDSCLGLFSYPVLMAADILLYKADAVPVGEDQRQHLELTRDIAGVINRKFNAQIFKLPELLVQSEGKRIMSLNDGNKKMSKSEISDLSRINLIDAPEQIYQKIKKAKTDNIATLGFDQINRPEIANLLNIYSAVTEVNIQNIIDKYSNSGFASFKKDLADALIAKLEPIRNKYNNLMDNQDYLFEILNAGANKAKATARLTLEEIKAAFGFI